MKIQWLIAIPLMLFSCVSLSEYNRKKAELAELDAGNKAMRKDIRNLEKDLKILQDTIAARNRRKEAIAESIRKRMEAYKFKVRIHASELEGLTIEKPFTDPAVYAELIARHTFKDTNSAKNTAWMSEREKKILYYLNFARMNPHLFCDRYIVPKWQRDTSNIYLLTLIDYMYTMKPMNALKPDKMLFDGAKCHAVESGKIGYVGHSRSGMPCTSGYMGECCSYGIEDPLGVIIQLLVDQGVSSLGHRYICLSWFDNVGIAQAPHKGFSVNTVLDFR